MSFRTEGFLSPDLEKFRVSVRTNPTYKVWFEFADDLNRLGLDMLERHETPRDQNQLLAVTILFIRAHQSYQAALILAEKGMIGDARVVLRSAVEGAIALNALANDQQFYEQLVNALHFNRRKLARLMLNNLEYQSTLPGAQNQNLEATVRQVDNLEQLISPKKLSDINWANIAEKYCKDLYNLLYRQLSSDGTHTTLESIGRYLHLDERKQIVALKRGPDVADLVDTLKMACLMLLWAAEPFVRVYGKSEFEPTIQQLTHRFVVLPQDEPTNFKD